MTPSLEEACQEKSAKPAPTPPAPAPATSRRVRHQAEVAVFLDKQIAASARRSKGTGWERMPPSVMSRTASVRRSPSNPNCSCETNQKEGLTAAVNLRHPKSGVST